MIIQISRMNTATPIPRRSQFELLKYAPILYSMAHPVMKIMNTMGMPVYATFTLRRAR